MASPEQTWYSDSLSAKLLKSSLSVEGYKGEDTDS